MEITIKLTDSELQNAQIAGAVAQILGVESAEVHKDAKEPQTREAEAVTPPWEEDVPQMNPPEVEQKPEPAAEPEEQKEPAPAAEAGPEELRSQIRQIGNKLTTEGRASEMLQVFKEFGVTKLSAIKDSDLAEVIKKVEAL